MTKMNNAPEENQDRETTEIPEEGKAEDDNYLVEAAKEQGAYQVSEDFARTKDIKDVLETKIVFFPELPKIEWSKLVNQRFIIETARIIQGWEGHFGTSSFPLLKIQTEDGRRYTTLGSGVAILKQVQRLINQKAFPVKTSLKTVQGENSAQAYYSLGSAQ